MIPYSDETKDTLQREFDMLYRKLETAQSKVYMYSFIFCGIGIVIGVIIGVNL